MPGLGRAKLGAACTAACSFDESSELASEPKRFIHAVLNETHQPGLNLVTLPRKEATMYLSKAAMERCVPGDIVETGVFTGGSSITILRALLNMDRCFESTGRLTVLRVWQACARLLRMGGARLTPRFQASRRRARRTRWAA